MRYELNSKKWAFVINRKASERCDEPMHIRAMADVGDDDILDFTKPVSTQEEGHKWLIEHGYMPV